MNHLDAAGITEAVGAAQVIVDDLVS